MAFLYFLQGWSYRKVRIRETGDVGEAAGSYVPRPDLGAQVLAASDDEESRACSGDGTPLTGGGAASQVPGSCGYVRLLR